MLEILTTIILFMTTVLLVAQYQNKILTTQQDTETCLHALSLAMHIAETDEIPNSISSKDTLFTFDKKNIPIQIPELPLDKPYFIKHIIVTWKTNQKTQSMSLKAGPSINNDTFYDV